MNARFQTWAAGLFLLVIGTLFCLAIYNLQTTEFSPTATTQEPEQDKTVVEFAEKYEKMFSLRDPKLGTMVADVSAYDENGQPFELKQTRGKHTVLVFGCLT